MIRSIHDNLVKSRQPITAVDRMMGFFVSVARPFCVWLKTPGVLSVSPGHRGEGKFVPCEKSRYSQIIRNCLGYAAFSRDLEDKLLQRQAKALLDLLSKNEFLLCEGIGPCLADDNPSTHRDFIQRQKWRLGYDK